jgi:bla regulator protein BlaR1
MSLQLTPSGIVGRLAGRCIATVLVAGSFTGTLSAHAEPVAAAPTYAVAMVLEAGGEKSAPRVLAKAGEQFAVASGDWRVEMTVRQSKTSDDVWLTGKVFKGSKVISAPTLMAHVNENVVIKVGENSDPFSLSMVVSAQP